MTAGWPFDAPEAFDPATSGAKAARLADLRRAGLQVPPGWVVGVTADPRRAAVAAISTLGARSWAVRSSAPEGDGHLLSMASSHTSELAVTDAGLSAAISRVRQTDHGPIPVLVMPTVEAEWGGVAFTEDPVDGIPRTVIEAVAGSTTATTAGTQHPHRLRIAVDGALVRRAPDGPGTEVVELVAGVARRVAELAGEPRDVEWASTDGQVWLLQARPITARQLPIAVELPPRQRWELSRDHRWRPPYPLEHSVWAPCLERSMQRALATVGAPAATMEQRLIGGWAYHRLRPLGDGSRDDAASPPAWLAGLAARLVPQLRTRLATAARAAAGDPGDRLISEWEGDGRRRHRDRTRALREAVLRDLDDAGLAQHLDAVLDHLQAAADAHAELPLATTYLRLGQLGVWCRDHLGWDAASTLAAVAAARGSPSSPVRDLAGSLAPGESAAHGAGGLGPAHTAGVGSTTALDDFLQEHGQQTFGVDLASPTWHEDPDPLLHLVAHLPAPPEPAAPAGRQPLTTLLADLPADQARTYRQLLARAVESARYGDQTETDVLEALALVRSSARETGRRFADRGELTDASDVLFLTTAELRARLSAEELPVDLERRRAEYRWAVAHPGPRAYGPPPGEMPSLRWLPRPGAQAWSAMLWAVRALGGEPSTQQSGGRLEGVGASPGRARGPVRLVRGSADFSRVQRGEILVCHSTLASWAVLFPVIAGVVSEVGGALSHPAILAREHGLPAVVGVSGVLEAVADGDIVDIDGSAGTVELS